MSLNGPEEADLAIDALISVGYSCFLVFDNFGNPLLRLSGADRQKFDDLKAYLYSNKKHGVDGFVKSSDAGEAGI